VGVLAYRPALDPHLVGGVPAYWRRLARVVEVAVEMMAVAVVEAVVVVLPMDAQAEDDDNDPDVLNPPPPYRGHRPVPPNKPPLLEP